MATSGPTNLPAFFNTDTDFRNFITGVRTVLTAGGLVQTADTGQVNAATVTKPAGSSTFQGYDIWRFADTLQATVPIFMKIEYGSGGAADRPSLRTTFGTASNGSGTLTGAVSSVTTTSAGGSKVATAVLPIVGAGGTGYFALCANQDVSNSSFAIYILIERTRDSTGAFTSDGFICGSSGGGGGQFAIIAGGSVTSVTSIVPPVVGRSPSGGNAAYAQMLYFIGAPFFGLTAARVNQSDLAALATASVTVLGGAHTVIGLNVQTSNLYAGSSTNTDTVAMIWE